MHICILIYLYMYVNIYTIYCLKIGFELIYIMFCSPDPTSYMAWYPSVLWYLMSLHNFNQPV